MVSQIEVETLRAWLEEGRPVTILDVRTAEDRAQWSIPGSRHIDVYADLKAGRAGALDGVETPSGVTVVTVCGAGHTSQKAAEQLEARGIHALSLNGGMKAWSLAWNTAPVPLDHGAARVIQVRRTGKGCLSYLVGAASEALVIDASLPAEIYIRLAEREGWTIRYVLDTHIHADHLARSRSLASRTGASYLLPSQNRARFPFRAVADGDSLEAGGARLATLHTPGHTDESVCYLLDGQALFTGDTLFPDGVGRPDLHAEGEEARRRAGLLFRSLGRLFAHDPEVLVLAGHASQPVAFDGLPLAARLGEVRSRIEAWLCSEEGFVERVLARVPPPPSNHQRIVEFNEAGSLPDFDVTDLEAGANRCAVS